MKHVTQPSFWRHYGDLSPEVQKLADKNYELLKRDFFHPFLHFNKVGRRKQLWSVRVGEHYRALAFDELEGVVCFGSVLMPNTIRI